MGDRRLVQRLSGGEILVHGDAAALLAELVEIAVRTEPRLLTVDSDDARHRCADTVERQRKAPV
jgi:hypothetical protein